MSRSILLTGTRFHEVDLCNGELPLECFPEKPPCDSSSDTVDGHKKKCVDVKEHIVQNKKHIHHHEFSSSSSSSSSPSSSSSGSSSSSDSSSSSSSESTSSYGENSRFSCSSSDQFAPAVKTTAKPTAAPSVRDRFLQRVNKVLAGSESSVSTVSDASSVSSVSVSSDNDSSSVSSVSSVSVPSAESVSSVPFGFSD